MARCARRIRHIGSDMNPDKHLKQKLRAHRWHLTDSVSEVRALDRCAMMRGRKGPKEGPLILGKTALDRRSSNAALTALSVSLMHSASLLSTELVCIPKT